MRTSVLALVFTGILTAACSGSDGSGDEPTGGSGAGSPGDQPSPAALFGPGVSSVVVEIDYATGAEPYTGSAAAFGDVWDISQEQMNRLFEPSGTTWELPHTLEDMEELDDVPRGDFGFSDIQPIVAAHRDVPPLLGDRASIYVLWVDGYFRDEDGRNESVLGVSFGDTGVIAMFKPVIAGTSAGPLVGVEKFVEQATLVHELGHAVGLVNNGLPLTSAHHDAVNGAHCTNEDCIMNWTIESTSGAIDYVTQSLTTPEALLWGRECLDDAEGASL